MNAETLLDELAGLGIRLEREGEAIFAAVQDGADVTLHAERIKTFKPDLLAALQLREHIIAAAIVEPEEFDRSLYDALWIEYDAL